MNSRALIALLSVCLALALRSRGVCSADSAPDPARINFSRDILPILSSKCFQCHGPDESTRAAELRLDTRDGAVTSDNPVIHPGRSGDSELVRRITSTDDAERMPPPDVNRQLSAAEIALLTEWVDQGAEWGGHWAFETPARPAPPVLASDDWSRNPIDRFVVEKLRAAGLTPSAAAGPEVLLRRVTLDLTGLPPSPSEMDGFLGDHDADAYERAVERLLASPRYGERWGRHWLDVARYADSTGFETDAPRSNWRYRDWVIESLNSGLRFDEFTIQQLAGDQLPGATTSDRIATGFLLCGPQDGGSEPSRLDAVVERVMTVGSVFLGLSVGCAQCHSHKFDPLSQRDYYGLFAFFNAADESVLELAPAEDVARRNALQAQLVALTAERDAYVQGLQGAKLQQDPGYLERTRTIDSLKQQIPDLPHAPVLQQPAASRTTTLFIRGEYTQPGEPVPAGVPQCLPPMPAGQASRVDFARWLTSPDHPLTARVTVNRVWQHFFGRGLVETENDFGVQGARPSHPELLDWLAREFVDGGWDLKRLQKLIVCSATYRQSSSRREELDVVDADNRLLARQSRLRLEAETILDAALAASGLLSSKIGGPGVFPFQHEGVMLNRATPAEWKISAGEDRYRRGMYTYYWRLTPHPFLQTFDAPDSLTACTRRRPSNTPLQALTLLNDPVAVECAQHLATGLLAEAPGDLSPDRETQRITDLFRRCLSREPDPDEQQAIKQVLTAARAAAATHDVSDPAGVERAAWTQACRVLLNVDEFVSRE